MKIIARACSGTPASQLDGWLWLAGWRPRTSSGYDFYCFWRMSLRFYIFFIFFLYFFIFFYIFLYFAKDIRIFFTKVSVLLRTFTKKYKKNIKRLIHSPKVLIFQDQGSAGSQNLMFWGRRLAGSLAAWLAGCQAWRLLVQLQNLLWAA